MTMALPGRTTGHQLVWAGIILAVTVGTAALCSLLIVAGFHTAAAVWLGILVIGGCGFLVGGKMDAIGSGIGYFFLGLLAVFVTAYAVHSSLLDLVGQHTRAVVVSVRAELTDDDTGATVFHYTMAQPSGRRVPGGELETTSDTGSRPKFADGDVVDIVYDSGGTISPRLADEVGNGGWIGAGTCWLLLLALLARAYVVGRRTHTVSAGTTAGTVSLSKE